jgi:hypothetical protein
MFFLLFNYLPTDSAIEPEIISSFIEVFAQGKEHLNPKFSGVVNA